MTAPPPPSTSQAVAFLDGPTHARVSPPATHVRPTPLGALRPSDHNVQRTPLDARDAGHHGRLSAFSACDVWMWARRTSSRKPLPPARGALVARPGLCMSPAAAPRRPPRAGAQRPGFQDVLASPGSRSTSARAAGPVTTGEGRARGRTRCDLVGEGEWTTGRAAVGGGGCVGWCAQVPVAVAICCWRRE